MNMKRREFITLLGGAPDARLRSTVRPLRLIA
jgi:hypothetical protein